MRKVINPYLDELFPSPEEKIYYFYIGYDDGWDYLPRKILADSEIQKWYDEGYELAQDILS